MVVSLLSGRVQQLVDHAADRRGRGADGPFDDRAQADALVEDRRLASDDHGGRRDRAERVGRGEQRVGLEAVRIEQWATMIPWVPGGRRRLEHGDRSGLVAARDRVDEHQRVVAVEQFVRQVHTTDPDVHDDDAIGKRLVCEPRDDLDAEAVVAEEDVPEAGHEQARAHVRTPIGSISDGSKYR
jgi:hypothetical protein